MFRLIFAISRLRVSRREGIVRFLPPSISNLEAGSLPGGTAVGHRMNPASRLDMGWRENDGVKRYEGERRGELVHRVVPSKSYAELCRDMFMLGNSSACQLMVHTYPEGCPLCSSW